MIIHTETRLIFVIWHMEQTRPCQTRATHCDSLEARGDQGSITFFYRHFFLGNQGQVFLFLHLIPNHIYALYWNAHFKTIQGTKSGRFFYTIIETYPSTLAAPVDIQIGFKQTTCTAPKTNKDPKCQKGPY